jgi:hypothetical protein
MSTFLTALVGKLPVSLQPYAKALVPVVVAAVALLVQVVETNTFDTAELLTAVGAAVVTLLTLAVPNRGYTGPPVEE